MSLLKALHCVPTVQWYLRGLLREPELFVPAFNGPEMVVWLSLHHLWALLAIFNFSAPTLACTLPLFLTHKAPSSVDCKLLEGKNLTSSRPSPPKNPGVVFGTQWMLSKCHPNQIESSQEASFHPPSQANADIFCREGDFFGDFLPAFVTHMCAIWRFAYQGWGWGTAGRVKGLGI